MNYKNLIKNLYETEIPPEKRTLSNCPKYSTGKNKMHPSKWLGIKSNGGQGYDGKFYGWTHRAIAGFGVGDTISGNSMAHKDYKWDDSDNNIKHEPYKIKTTQSAKEHAIRFMKNVS